MNTPKISVIMPVWNGETYLREAIDSILNQTLCEFEFLIINDGSTDSTAAILEEYTRRDSRIRVISLDHQGIVMALNRGVEEARTQWIARMDCDDIAHPERLELQMKALERHPEAVLCYSDIDHFGEASGQQGKRRLAKSDAMLKVRLCYSSPFVHPTVVFSKEAFLAVGGYRPAERHAEDFALWGRLRSQGRFVGIRRPLLKLRLHFESISKQKAAIQRELARKISLQHCHTFLNASPSEALQLWSAFHGDEGSKGVGTWLWLGSRFLIHLRPQSFELWAWFFSQTIRRTFRNAPKGRHDY